MSELAANFRHAFFRLSDPAERIRTLKTLLADERERIREQFLSGATAQATTARLADLVDAFLRALLEARRNTTPAASELALVAVGGYGRREMCPRSDVDLLILIPKKASPAVLAEAEQILYPLWDMGFVVGQAVRTVADCRKAADEDVETYTAFLQERFLGGAFALYKEFADFVAERPSGRHQKKLTQMKLAEREKRLLAQGQLAQTLEPNLKEGRGCLRDLHTLVWLAGIQIGARNVEDLVRSGIVSPEELEDVRAANEFLLRARIALHYGADGKTDRMGFEDQEAIARTLGYQDTEKGPRAVERFQKDFYAKVRTVDSITSQYCDRVAAQDSRRVRTTSPDPRFRIVDGSLEMPVEGLNPFLSNIGLVLDLFRAAQKAHVGVGATTRWYVRQAVGLADPDEIDLAALLPKLLDIARHTGASAFTLRELHRLGVINLVVPDFKLIDCHSQHDIYHLYTTDEHTLTVLSRLATLGKSDDPVLQHLKAEMLKVPDLDILMIAGLFHDVGKGLGPDHSDTGARLVRDYCRRAGISDSRATQASELVQHHLLLNFLAQRRDIDDPRTIRDLLARIDDPHLLRKLYILTWADTSSVHPDAWSAWKANLLLRLYNGAMLELESEESERLDSNSRREALAQEAFGHPREEVLEHLKRLPRRYASSVSARQLADHLDLVQALSGRRRCAVKAHNHGSHWDLAIVSADRPGLLARICAALTTLRLSIVSSQVYTRVDGVVIDLFSVIAEDPAMFSGDAELAQRTEQRLTELRDLGTEDLQQAVDSHIRRWSASVSRIMVPKVRVEFQDQESDDYTLLDITAPDRLGLLFDLTLYLSKRQWVIHSARVCTEADRALDSFSLTTPEGRPILDEEARRTARADLQKLLQL